MTRFYQIARLVAGQTIFPGEAGLRIDLDAVTPDDMIENDVAFRAAIAPDMWFWLSGGGTLLLNNRHLCVVRRSPDARINPGKFSLFTGRADNAVERADPGLIVRELFEELLLYEGDALLVPRLAAIQPVINSAYDVMRQAGVVAERPTRDLPLTPVPLPARQVTIRHGGITREHWLTWIAGANNDVNILSLFAADCDLSQLKARDGEFHLHDGGVRMASRAIYLLDLVGGQARPLSADGPAFIPQREEMTPPLQFLLDACHGIRRK